MRRGPLIAGIVVALASFSGFWELAEDFSYSPAVIGFDARVSAVVQGWRAAWLTEVMTALTTSGGVVLVVLATAGIAVAFWIAQRRFEASFAATAVAVGALLSVIAKDSFGRARPPIESALVALPGTFSFPSGHAMASLCLATGLGYLALRSRVRPAAKVAAIMACTLWALTVGLSRVYLGVHWPSDVLASWLLGGSWLAVAIGVVEAKRPAR